MKIKFKFLFYIILLLSVSLKSQNRGIELYLGGFLNQSSFDQINYTIQDQIRTTEKLFNSGLPIFKLSYINDNGTVFSLNHTNYGAFSEGNEKISSRVSAIGFGIGKEYRTNSDLGLWNLISLDFGMGIEIRGNYNYDHQGVKIIVTGQIANQIKVVDEIEKFVPELVIDLPRVSVGLIKSDNFEVFGKLSYHLIYAEKLSNKFSNKSSFNFLKINNTVELLSISAGLKIKW